MFFNYFSCEHFTLCLITAYIYIYIFFSHYVLVIGFLNYVMDFYMMTLLDFLDFFFKMFFGYLWTLKFNYQRDYIYNYGA